MLRALCSTYGAGTPLHSGQPYRAHLPLPRYAQLSSTQKVDVMVLPNIRCDTHN